MVILTKNSEALPPVESSVHVKWTEAIEEPLGWYKVWVDLHFLDRSCKIVCDDSDDCIISEVVEWKPCF